MDEMQIVCILGHASARTEKERVTALVISAQKLNDLSFATNDPFVKEEIIEILKEQRKLWAF